MANQPCRILLRLQFGLPARLLSQEEREQAHPIFLAILRQWKSSGVRHIASFTAAGGEGHSGYAHIAILEIDNPEGINELNSMLYLSGLPIEKYSFELSYQPSYFEQNWDAA